MGILNVIMMYDDGDDNDDGCDDDDGFCRMVN